MFIHRNPSRKELFFTAELDWCPLLCVDSQVVDLVFAMEDMERGLQEMAQSVEHMQEMLKRSPMVQALAQREPVRRSITGSGSRSRALAGGDFTKTRGWGKGRGSIHRRVPRAENSRRGPHGQQKSLSMYISKHAAPRAARASA